MLTVYGISGGTVMVDGVDYVRRDCAQDAIASNVMAEREECARVAERTAAMVRTAPFALLGAPPPEGIARAIAGAIRERNKTG